MKKAVILAPHPDDGEFSSGGTINRFILEKNMSFGILHFPRVLHQFQIT